MTRIAARPGERIDRSRSIAFTFDGREMSGLAGDTVGSALFAAGVRTFSRSFKYHRRRGLIQARQHLGREQPDALLGLGVRQEAGSTDEDQMAETAEFMEAFHDLPVHGLRPAGEHQPASDRLLGGHRAQCIGGTRGGPGPGAPRLRCHLGRHPPRQEF